MAANDDDDDDGAVSQLHYHVLSLIATSQVSYFSIETNHIRSTWILATGFENSADNGPSDCTQSVDIIEPITFCTSAVIGTAIPRVAYTCRHADLRLIAIRNVRPRREQAR